MPQRGNFIAGAGYTNYPVRKGFFVFVILTTLNVLVFLVGFLMLSPISNYFCAFTAFILLPNIIFSDS